MIWQFCAIFKVPIVPILQRLFFVGDAIYENNNKIIFIITLILFTKQQTLA